MTTWQWKVIVALVRTILRIRNDGMLAEDESLFEEVLDREEKNANPN